MVFERKKIFIMQYTYMADNNYDIERFSFKKQLTKMNLIFTIFLKKI